MKTITDHLADYAAYHRDRRNIATHLIGIPMIVIALQILLSRPHWAFDGRIFQFIGHFFEGRKPAFVDDIMGLAIDRLFVGAEVVFMLGLKKDLHQAIEKRFS